MTTARLTRLRHLISQPVRLESNRVWRFYQGGRLIDTFRGLPGPEDNYFPEDWVGSITPARNEGRDSDEGLTRLTLPDGESITLKELVETIPDEVMGREHVATYGPTTGLLVKLLDSAVRLPVHCHPTRDFARRYLDSIFGKTEAWIVIGTRSLDGQRPYVMLGFQEEVDRATFCQRVLRQEVQDITAGLHRLEVQPGDVYYVKAGLPHAIGPGVFLVEVQEPTDWFVLAEWDGFPIDGSQGHMGLGWDLAMEVFDYTAYHRDQVLREFKLEPELLVQRGPCRELQLLGGKTAEFFSATRVVVRGEYPVEYRPGFYIGVVTAGRGALVGSFGEFPLQQGDTFLCTAAVPRHAIRSAGTVPLEMVRCLPPV